MTAGPEVIEGQDEAGRFEIDVHNAGGGGRTVLFSAGRGGNPRRYRSLIESFSAAGHTVIAPHFDMMASPMPSGEDLRARLRRFERTFEAVPLGDAGLIGVGHSIGAALLLVLGGGVATTIAGETVSARPGQKFVSQALLAPALDFFRAPGALARLDTPLAVWAGQNDAITPPDRALLLKQAVRPGLRVEVLVDAHAGHFSFMDELPPNIVDPHPDRPAFLAGLGAQLCRQAIA